MLEHQAQLQQNYLHTLLVGHSPQAIRGSERVRRENEKYQHQISQGQILIVSPDPMVSGSQRYGRSRQITDPFTIGKSKSMKRESGQIKVLSKQEHQRIMKGIVQQKRMLNREKDDRRRDEDEEKRREDEERKQLMEEAKFEKQIQRKKMLKEKIDGIGLQTERRKSEMKLQNKIIGKLLNDAPLHQRLEKNYLMQEEAQTLEQKKKRLAEIRSLHKPITKEELMEHEKKIHEYKDRLLKKDMSDSRLRSHSLMDVYKSDYYKKAAQQNPAKQLQKIKQTKAEQAYQFQQKIRQYNKYVKGNFKPQVDERLVKQLKSLNTVDIRKSLPVEQLKQIGQDYLLFNIANKKEYSIDQAMETPTSQKEIQNNSFQNKPFKRLRSRAQKIDKPEDIKTDRSPRRQRSRQNGTTQAREKVDHIYLRKRDQSQQQRSKSQLQQDIRYIKRKQQGLDNLMDQKQLDKLYDKILKVKMSIDRSTPKDRSPSKQ